MFTNENLTSDLEFIADSIMIERYLVNSAVERGNIKLAFDLSGAFGQIGEFVKGVIDDNWDPKRPTASIMALGARGILGMFFGWWAVAIEIICEDFLGIKFIDLFDKIKEAIVKAINGKEKLSFSSISSLIDQSTQGGSSAPAPEVDATPVPEVSQAIDARAAWEESLNVFRQVQSIYTASDRMIEKSAGAASTVLRTLFRAAKFPFSLAKSFISKLLKFIFKCAWKALTNVVAKKALAPVSRMLGGNPTGGKGQSGPNHTLHPSMFGQEREASDWAIQMPITQVPEMLFSWLLKVYPQFQAKQEEARKAMDASSKYQQMIKAITENSRETIQDNIVYMPIKVGGYAMERKADVVNFFVQDIVDQLGIGKV